MTDPFAPPRPVLQLVKQAQKAEQAGHWLMLVSVDMNDGLGPQDFPFDYDPNDQWGLTPQVRDWLKANSYSLPE